MVCNTEQTVKLLFYFTSVLKVSAQFKIMKNYEEVGKCSSNMHLFDSKCNWRSGQVVKVVDLKSISQSSLLV
jgi:hypothetical protein